MIERNIKSKDLTPICLWITGLPGSGKSTIAEGIVRAYPYFVILRMDEVRRFVTPSPSYSEEEREMVYRSLVYLAKTLYRLKHNVIIDATANRRRWRELARQNIPNFVEIYIKCPVAICQEREKQRLDTHSAPKDIYKKGVEGSPVPGMSVPYEAPLEAELTIDTGILKPEESIIIAVNFIADLLHRKNTID